MLFPSQPTPAEAYLARCWAWTAVAWLLWGVGVSVALSLTGFGTAILWTAAILTFLILLAAVFCCARARVLSWDARHPWPPDNDGGGGGGGHGPGPDGGTDLDWNRFERAFRRYVEHTTVDVS